VGFRPVLYWYVLFHILVRYEYTADFCLMWGTDKPGIETHINIASGNTILICFFISVWISILLHT
jgi:hypothetical protein